MLFWNDRRRTRNQSKVERAQVHKTASEDINPYVSRKEKYEMAAKSVDAKKGMK
jgi:hypothetical protein